MAEKTLQQLTFILWEEARVDTQGEHGKTMLKDPMPGFEPRTYLLKGKGAINSDNVQAFNSLCPK